MKKFAVVVSIMLALTFLLLPATVLAANPTGGNCPTQTLVMKWSDNPVSAKLYLNNWGKTPIQAMSQIGNVAVSSSGKTVPTWGSSLPVANLSWSGNAASSTCAVNKPPLCTTGCCCCEGTWGQTGFSLNPNCQSQIWALACNEDANSAACKAVPSK